MVFSRISTLFYPSCNIFPLIQLIGDSRIASIYKNFCSEGPQFIPVNPIIMFKENSSIGITLGFVISNTLCNISG